MEKKNKNKTRAPLPLKKTPANKTKNPIPQTNEQTNKQKKETQKKKEDYIQANTNADTQNCYLFCFRGVARRDC